MLQLPGAVFLSAGNGTRSCSAAIWQQAGVAKSCFVRRALVERRSYNRKHCCWKRSLVTPCI